VLECYLAGLVAGEVHVRPLEGLFSKQILMHEEEVFNDIGFLEG
jgi:hypothetical protein